MQKISLEHSGDAGQRIDRFLKKFLPNAPLGAIYKMLRTGKIKINGKKKDQTYKTIEGDEITFWLSDDELEEFRALPHPATVSLSPKQTSSKLEVLYEDAVLMVVNKPAKMNVHPGDHKSHEVSLIELVQDMLGKKYNSLTFRPALVHRIDRDTSGCVVIAKEKHALEALLGELQSHTFEKVYHALVVGIPHSPSGTIREKLLRIEDAKNEAKVRVDEAGQNAVTHYKLLKTKTLDTQGAISLLECRIETGRTHQIRAHLAHMGTPIIADKLYGDKKINAYFARHYKVERQMLHARKISFPHPITHKNLTVEAPYHSDWLDI